MFQIIKNVVYTTITMLICNNICIAQNFDMVDVQKSFNGNISFARLKPSDQISLNNSANFLKQCLKINSDEDYIEINSEDDKYGNSHKKFQQYNMNTLF